MAAILQFRQGSTDTFTSQGASIAEPFFDTYLNTLVVGTTSSLAIKLTKLDEINLGSFDINGSYTGSNLYLSGNLTASNAIFTGSVSIDGDINLGGNLFLGDQVQDNITVTGQFSSNLIPSASEAYTLGTGAKKWLKLHAVSASIDNIDLVSNLPSGVVSSSVQIVDSLPIGSVSGSEQVIDFLPVNTVSGSDQVLGGTSIVSSSQQVTNFLPTNTISSSQQVVDFLPTNVVSGSGQILGGTNVVSSSIQVTNFLPSGTISGSTQLLDSSNVLSSSNETFNIYSSSVDSRLNPLEVSTTALNSISHSHVNKSNLDTINQNLSTTSPVQFNSLQVGQIEGSGDIDIAGTASFDSNVTIYGDLTVFGTESIVNAENLSIADNMIYLNSGSTSINPDLGWAGNYNDGTYAHAGIFRDASDGVYKFYDGYIPEPEGSIDVLHPSFTLAPIQADSVTATLITSNNFIGNGSQLVFPATNIVSSSQQVINFLPSGIVSGSSQVLGGTSIVSSSQQVINFLPINTISGSDQILGGTSIVSSSQQVTNFLPSGTISGSIQIISILESSSPGLVSGSDQITESLDIRYLEINGDGVVTGSDQLTASLDSVYAQSSSLYDLVGNFPTSGSLGTSAFYNVSSSLGDDPNVIPNVKAVYDYINNTIGAADITGVSASLGLFGGGASGDVTLSLDTASLHFQQGVELYGTNQAVVIDIMTQRQVLSGSYLGIATTDNLTEGSNLYWTQDRFNSAVNASGIFSQSAQVDIRQTTNFNDTIASINQYSDAKVKLKLDLDGVISGSPQLTQNISTSEIIVKNSDNGFTGSNHYADSINLSVGSSTPTSVSSTEQLTVNGTTPTLSGVVAFTESDVLKSFDYVSSNVRFVDSNSGVSIALKPDADGSKAWLVDTDGDLVSNGGAWTSGNAYMNNLIASSSVTASNMLVDFDITADNFIGNLQSTNGVVSGSQQVINLLPTGTFSGSVDTILNGTGVLSGSAIDNGFVDLTSTQTISGTKTFNDIVVNGTGSFAYFVSTESELNVIGQSFIVLNNDTPTERYAGIAVYDSGSVGVTSSFQYDGSTDDWFFEKDVLGSTEYGIALFGPEYSVKGTPTYPTNNTIQKGNGGHHLLDSTITDDGTTITLGSDSIILGVGEFSSFTEITGSVSIQQGLNVEGNATFSNAQFDDISASTVSATGDIVAYASSDRRLKDKIVPIPFALDKINSIGGYSFEWNTQKQDIYKGKDYGVVAQEIEEILPELVQTRENGYKAVKYDKLVSLLIEGIKELSQEVNELKEKLNRE